MTRRRTITLSLSLALVTAAALLPYVGATVPVLFDGPLNSPGVLQLLALMLVSARSR